jgi:membrane-associated protein
MEFLHTLVTTVADHAPLAYAVVFAAAALEAVPVLGSFVPGSTLILGLGALIPGGHLSLVPMLAAAVSGAFIGDTSAYFLGHRNKQRILTLWPLSRYPELIATSERLFHRYGAWAVLFARFVPPVRALVPITAGALALPPRRFVPTDAVAVVLWACAHILPGVLAGSALERISATAEHYAAPLLMALIAIGLVGYGVAWLRRRNVGEVAADAGDTRS